MNNETPDCIAEEPTTSGPPLDLATLRRRLAGREGRQYWRSLEEVAGSDEFTEMLHREFPRHASEWDNALDRRKFLTLMGASLALAGLTGCSDEAPEKIIPYVEQPEAIVPGKPLYFATSMPRRGGAIGLLAESHMGRPTKLEGNELHPASLGATDAQTQAAILSMYDPDRSQTLKHLGQISTWEAFLEAIRPSLAVAERAGGARLRVLCESVFSPTLARQIEALQARFPRATVHYYEPVANDNLVRGAELAFGEAVDAIHHFDRADVVLALDCDFTSESGSGVRHARDFASRRSPSLGGLERMSRLYVVEGTPGCAGAVADHRWPLRSSEIGKLVRALAAELGVEAAGEPPVGGSVPDGFDPTSERTRVWLDALVEDLTNSRGRGIVIAGRNQPAYVHALVHAINAALGNSTAGGDDGEMPIEYVAPVDAGGDTPHMESLGELTAALDAGEVEILLMLGGNPVYDAPIDLQFREKLAKAPTAIHLHEYENETSQLSQWHIPQTHFLEMWSDAQAYNGIASIIQPLIAPLYRGQSPHSVLSAFVDKAVQGDYELLQATWAEAVEEEGFEAFWRRAVHDGLIESTAAEARDVSIELSAAAVQQAVSAAGRRRTSDGEVEVSFLPDPSVDDGRFANNGWLQEVPRPQTKLCWGNACMIAPSTAEQFGVATGDMVLLDGGGDLKLRAAVWILPGQAVGQVTLHLGYGRENAGRVGSGVGFNAYRLRTSGAPWIMPGVKLRKMPETERLVTTQEHFSIEGRDIIRQATVDEYAATPSIFDVHGHGHGEHGHDADPAHGAEPAHAEQDAEAVTHTEEGTALHGIRGPDGKTISLYPDRMAHEGYAWGMSIDLSTCMGCNACVVACQAENNIPIVGPEAIERGREMHWLRIDRYYEGDLDEPNMLLQPMLCQHCEKAPCETVCPVAATTHSPEGLNEMTYNRCIGTRYCSNNCPYKVRRFNFFDYTDESPVMELLRNPDVTVRGRGVMEKCTYCVQRINTARIDAKKRDVESGTNEGIQDGEIVTACQSACPSRAITFGDINDPDSQVSRKKSEPRNYGVLEELGTRPRTTYLGIVRNPHPLLAAYAERQAAARAEANES